MHRQNENIVGIGSHLSHLGKLIELSDTLYIRNLRGMGEGADTVFWEFFYIKSNEENTTTIILKYLRIDILTHPK